MEEAFGWLFSDRGPEPFLLCTVDLAKAKYRWLIVVKNIASLILFDSV